MPYFDIYGHVCSSVPAPCHGHGGTDKASGVKDRGEGGGGGGRRVGGGGKGGGERQGQAALAVATVLAPTLEWQQDAVAVVEVAATQPTARYFPACRQCACLPNKGMLWLPHYTCICNGLEPKEPKLHLPPTDPSCSQ